MNKSVHDVFNVKPELANIGTPEQYIKYLQTIFPDSKVKDVVWHGTKKPLENNKFDFNKSERGNKGAVWFSQMRPPQKTFGQDVVELYGNYEIPAIINLKNPLRFGDKSEKVIDEVMISKLGVNKKTYDILIKHGYDGMYDRLLDEKTINEYEGDAKKWNYNQFVVLEPEQIHILGSTEDISKFVDFLSKETSDWITWQ